MEGLKSEQKGDEANHSILARSLRAFLLVITTSGGGAKKPRAKAPDCVFEFAAAFCLANPGK